MFRIAHCSDLHLLSLEGARTLDFFNKRWIGGMNLLSNRARHYHTALWQAMVQDLNAQSLDHVLVTGDVTNLALEQEFIFARKLFNELRYDQTAVTVLPGNHDAYVQHGVQYFAKHFGAFCSSDGEVGTEKSIADKVWPFVRVRGDIAIIGLSTSHQTPWFTAYGRAGEDQLQRLRRLLASDALADKFRLVAIHHPPAGPKSESLIRGFRDRDSFARILAEAGAELVLHGHEHLDLRTSLPTPHGKVEVRGIQSSTYEAGNPERRARYRIYTIGRRPGAAASAALHHRDFVVSEEVRIWQPDQQSFAPVQKAA